MCLRATAILPPDRVLHIPLSTSGSFRAEYIRALIRRDLKSREEAWESLQKQLGPAMHADDSEFLAVTAEDVIRRNTQR